MLKATDEQEDATPLAAILEVASMASISEDEFTTLINSPLFQRLWTISQDVQAGRADEATTLAWMELRETILRVSIKTERALARYEPKDREQVLRRWMEAWLRQQDQGPTQH